MYAVRIKPHDARRGKQFITRPGVWVHIPLHEVAETYEFLDGLRERDGWFAALADALVDCLPDEDQVDPWPGEEDYTGTSMLDYPGEAIPCDPGLPCGHEPGECDRDLGVREQD